MSACAPKLPLTVSRALWDAMADATSPAFADSYLSGASEHAAQLIPHTVTATLALQRSHAAISVFKARGLKLLAPLPFGHPDRPDSRR